MCFATWADPLPLLSHAISEAALPRGILFWLYNPPWSLGGRFTTYSTEILEGGSLTLPLMLTCDPTLHTAIQRWAIIGCPTHVKGRLLTCSQCRSRSAHWIVCMAHQQLATKSDSSIFKWDAFIHSGDLSHCEGARWQIWSVVTFARNKLSFPVLP